VIGMFINTVVLRNYPQRDKPFIGFLREVKKNTLAAYDNQDFPFDQLVKEIAPKRDLSRFPLYDAGFVLHDFGTDSPDSKAPDIPGSSITVNPYKPKTVIAEDIYLETYIDDGKLCFNFRFSTHLFKKETVETFVAFFKNLAAAVCAEPGAEIKDIHMVSADEKSKLNVGIKDTRDKLQIEFDL